MFEIIKFLALITFLICLVQSMPTKDSVEDLISTDIMDEALRSPRHNVPNKSLFEIIWIIITIPFVMLYEWIVSLF